MTWMNLTKQAEANNNNNCIFICVRGKKFFTPAFVLQRQKRGKEGSCVCSQACRFPEFLKEEKSGHSSTRGATVALKLVNLISYTMNYLIIQHSVRPFSLSIVV